MLSVLLAAAIASSSPAIMVAPSDPSARFRGDSGTLELDPLCRDYTLDTLASNAGCAARVAKLEAATVLAIAARTITETPSRRKDAFELLERSAEATGSPAVHYFLSLWIGTGVYVKPDYDRAIRHASFATEHGNPAAAHLLASFFLDGKGVPRDIPRAIKLFESAAARGVPNSGVLLAKLYLTGVHVAKDEPRGRAWLSAVAKLDMPSDDPVAARQIDEAKRMFSLAEADAQGKISRYQLIPAPEAPDVKIVRYGAFDNPVVPANFGFDPDFSKLHYTSRDDLAVLARLESGMATLPTPYLYELAARLADRDEDRAAQVYFLARIRMSYDALRCIDPAAIAAVNSWDRFIDPDIRFMVETKALSAAAVAAALAAEAKMTGDTAPWWVCRSGLAELTAATLGVSGG